jgi:hypothetical protein
MNRNQKLFGALMALLVLLGASAPAMVFKPADIHLWDTWCFQKGDTWYLYFLTATTWDRWDGVAVCTSKDGVHWSKETQVIRKRDNCVWLGTGSTWKSPNFDKDGKFFCNFSEQPQGESQHIYFAESTDLLNWKRLDIEFRQDPRYYKEKGRWDCIYTIPKLGGGLYGYWTATPNEGVGLGFGESMDGVTWKALSSPVLEWGDNPLPEKRGIELGAVEKIGDRYYAMVGNGGRMSMFVGDKPEGPFRASAKNFMALQGDCYFARFFPSPDGMLVIHHSITGKKFQKKSICYAAPLKRAEVDGEGILRLMWWKGNESLKGAGLTPAVKRVANDGAPVFFESPVDVRRGTVVEGLVEFPTDAAATFPGFAFECAGGMGAICLRSSCSSEAGLMKPDGTGFQVAGKQSIDRQLPPKPQARFRLLVRHSLVELYLDDVLMNAFSLPEASNGRIGLLNGGEGLSDLKAWTMTLPDDAPPQKPGIE